MYMREGIPQTGRLREVWILQLAEPELFVWQAGPLTRIPRSNLLLSMYILEEIPVTAARNAMV